MYLLKEQLESASMQDCQVALKNDISLSNVSWSTRLCLSGNQTTDSQGEKIRPHNENMGANWTNFLANPTSSLRVVPVGYSTRFNISAWGNIWLVSPPFCEPWRSIQTKIFPKPLRKSLQCCSFLLIRKSCPVLIRLSLEQYPRCAPLFSLQ